MCPYNNLKLAPADNGHKVTFYQRHRLKKKIITQEDYKEYKDLVEDIARKTKQRIVLEEK